MGAEVVMERWGTWEELLLGGAVLRHGTKDWEAVAAEFRARTVDRLNFTPEACKAKYEDLQQHYSGCKALFEELRKNRMAELRQALELSEDSIGSLESKLETLKAETKDDCRVSYDSSQTGSLLPFEKPEGVESSSKETSKDGLSAGSFTRETRTNLYPESWIPASASAEEIETKPEVSVFPAPEKVLSIGKLAESLGLGQGSSLRRRRGKRKRKDCSKDVKEGSVGESDFWGSADVLSATRCKENSTSSSGQMGRLFDADDQCRGANIDGIVNLMGIFDSIAEKECASVFRRRLDSQKRGRYKKMILQHMDFDTIRSRIANRFVTSAKEIFRDMLLLANNALVFYSKSTREYKSALLLRHVLTKSLREHLANYVSRTTIALLSTTSPLLNPSVKPQNAPPCHLKMSGKTAKAGSVTKTPNKSKRCRSGARPPPTESLATTKKGSGRPRKTGLGSDVRQLDKPTKGRKRSGK